MYKYFLLYSLLILLNAFTVNAQKSPYNFPSNVNAAQLMISHWTVEEGLPSQGLRNFIQAQNGYIWIISYDGLIRFDGFDFKVFNSKNTEAFKENICSHITEDKNNTLWFLSRNRLLYYKKGVIKEISQSEELGKISDTLYIDAKNRLWLSSDKHGIFYIKNDKPVFFDNLENYGSIIKSATEDNSGNIYFGTVQNEIVKFDGKKFLSLLKAKKKNEWFIGYLHFLMIKYIGLIIKKTCIILMVLRL